MINFDNYDGPFLDLQKFLSEPTVKYNHITGEYWGGGGYVNISFVSNYDGDTAVFVVPTFLADLMGSASTRFFLMDSPELDPEEEWGNTAKEFTMELLTRSQNLLIQTDSGSKVTDHYGRLLGYIWIKPAGKTQYYLLNYLSVRNGFSYYGYPYNVGVEEPMSYNGLDYRSWMMLAGYRAEQEGLGVHGTQPESEFQIDYEEYFTYSNDEIVPITIPEGIPLKLDAISSIKNDIRNKLIEYGVPMEGTRFVEYPEKISEMALQTLEPVIFDISGNKWKRKNLFLRSEPPYNYYSIGWVIDDLSESQNVFAEDAILDWGAFDKLSDTYAGSINKVVVDGNYIYAVGVSTRSIRVYDKTTMQLMYESADQSGTINDIVVTDNFVFAAGNDGILRKYTKPNVSLLLSQDIAVETDSITALAHYGSAIFVGRSNGYITSFRINNVNQANDFIEKYNTLITAPVLDDIVNIVFAPYNASVLVDDKMYFAIGDQVYFYSKPSLGSAWSLQDTANYGAAIYALETDGQYIYVGGSTINAVLKYDLDLQFVGVSEQYPSRIEAIYVDDDYIYAGGLTEQKIYVYSKNTMQKLEESDAYGGTIRTIFAEENLVYCAGTTINKVARFNNYFTLKELRGDQE